MAFGDPRFQPLNFSDPMGEGLPGAGENLRGFGKHLDPGWIQWEGIRERGERTFLTHLALGRLGLKLVWQVDLNIPEKLGLGQRVHVRPMCCPMLWLEVSP